MEKILFLASQSPSRQMLLREAEIPFTVADWDADESDCDWGLPLKQLVASIVRHKMAHVIVPDGVEGQVAFVLTADTLSQDMDGTIQGKPVDRADAIAKIKKARDGSRLCTAFCLERRVWSGGAKPEGAEPKGDGGDPSSPSAMPGLRGWKVEERIERAVETSYRFIIPDEWIDIYLERSPGLRASNAIAVEGYGGQFLREVNGSYSTIVGMPMFELREALTELGFFGNIS